MVCSLHTQLISFQFELEVFPVHFTGLGEGDVGGHLPHGREQGCRAPNGSTRRRFGALEAFRAMSHVAERHAECPLSFKPLYLGPVAAGRTVRNAMNVGHEGE